jgi:hypothetical protein
VTPKLVGFVASGYGITRRFDHASGWHIEHCGHGTALRPWAVYDPSGKIHLRPHGGAFETLDLATAYVVEQLRAAAGGSR